MERKSLAEWNAQVGDKFYSRLAQKEYEVLADKHLKSLGNVKFPYSGYAWDNDRGWSLLSRAVPIKYGEWKIACEEIPLADDAQIINLDGGMVAYREVVKFVVAEKTYYLYKYKHTAQFGLKANEDFCPSSHKITFNIVDGVPDCSSIKMVKL